MPEHTTDHPRLRAIEALGRIDEQNTYIDRATNPEGLDARERRQLTEYVSGVTRQRRWLDFLLGRFYYGEVGDLQPKLRQILRLGLYEMLFLNTPIHAAVNESVELAKSELRRGAGGLVNGVLRAIDRSRDTLPVPDSGFLADDLAIRHSHPTWMVKRWLSRYGTDQTKHLLQWNNARPVHSIRVNELKVTSEAICEELDKNEIPFEASPYLPDFFRLPRLQPLFQTGLVDEGKAVIQDESAGLAVRMLSPEAGETIMDMCAAPGGKSLYIATLIANDGLVLACDLHQNRLDLLVDAASRAGLSCIQTIRHDARTLPASVSDLPADRVLLDAPCSGMGVLSKRADLRWQRGLSDLDDLTELQDELLDAAAEYVKPGGVIVYSTCTIEPEENEQRIDAFLERHPSFLVENKPEAVPQEVLTERGFMETFPPQHGIDGAFAARLRRSAA